jgi:uncharacterized protein YbjT (DUF2867 family)
VKVMLLGASGVTGREVLRGLLDAPEVTSVVAPVRSTLALTHARLLAPVVNFEQLASQRELFEVDAVVSCLGTTIRKAGSQDAFRRVDHDYPLQVAQLARAGGARHFLLMSALGARADAPVFYSRVKGQLEDALKALHFESLVIFQPGLLLGQRDEFRLGESLAGRVMPMLNAVLVGPFTRYRGIEVTTVARAIVRQVRQLAGPTAAATGLRVLHHDDMQALASTAH